MNGSQCFCGGLLRPYFDPGGMFLNILTGGIRKIRREPHKRPLHMI